MANINQNEKSDFIKILEICENLKEYYNKLNKISSVNMAQQRLFTTASKISIAICGELSYIEANENIAHPNNVPLQHSTFDLLENYKCYLTQI